MEADWPLWQQGHPLEEQSRPHLGAWVLGRPSVEEALSPAGTPEGSGVQPQHLAPSVWAYGSGHTLPVAPLRGNLLLGSPPTCHQVSVYLCPCPSAHLSLPSPPLAFISPLLLPSRSIDSAPLPCPQGLPVFLAELGTGECYRTMGCFQSCVWCLPLS